MRVAISTSTFGVADGAPLERLERAAEVCRNPTGRKMTATEVSELLQATDGLIAGTEPLTREVLESCERLKAISRVGAGTDNVDLEAARALGIAVSATPDAVTDAAAELTVGGMLCLLREVHRMHAELVAGEWGKRMGELLSGKVVGIVGVGRVGRRVAELLGPFGVELLGHDLDSAAVGRAPGVGRVALDELLARSDLVTLHAAPSTPASLVSWRELALMREGSYLVNVARGSLVDEEALGAALSAGALAGAYLDTFGQEPYEGPLRELPNVLLTPHVGSYARQARVRMEAEAVENLLQALEGVDGTA